MRETARISALARALGKCPTRRRLVSAFSPFRRAFSFSLAFSLAFSAFSAFAFSLAFSAFSPFSAFWSVVIIIVVFSAFSCRVPSPSLRLRFGFGLGTRVVVRAGVSVRRIPPVIKVAYLVVRPPPDVVKSALLPPLPCDFPPEIPAVVS